MEKTTSKVSPIHKLLSQLNLDIKTTDRYFKIHRTVVEMLEARGFQVGQAETESTESLLAFLKFLSDKKAVEDAEVLKELALELLEEKFFTDEAGKYTRFVSEEVPVLIEDMDIKEIVDSLKKMFKVSAKPPRPVDVYIDERIRYRKEMKAVETLNHLYQKPDGTLIQTYYFYNAEADKKKTPQIMIDILALRKRNRQIKDILFIADEPMNTQMTEDLKKFREDIKFTIFIGDHLLFNITKHFLVPKHHLMTEEEYKEFVKTEKNLLRKLPIIFETDPIARFYGAKPGQIFKIIRENLSDDGMVRFSEFYRYVTTEVKK
jgi:DNA-directed RNA polymerase subunit H (RpoH/RPB5)